MTHDQTTTDMSNTKAHPITLELCGPVFEVFLMTASSGFVTRTASESGEVVEEERRKVYEQDVLIRIT